MLIFYIQEIRVLLCCPRANIEGEYYLQADIKIP